MGTTQDSVWMIYAMGMWVCLMYGYVDMGYDIRLSVWMMYAMGMWVCLMYGYVDIGMIQDCQFGLCMISVC